MAKHEYEEATVNVKTSKRIRSGFYIDDRDYLRKQPDSLGRKVFLIIFAGNFADKVLVIRPNTGKRILAKHNVDNLLHKLRRCNDTNEALELWDAEFNLADIPYEEKYQFSCHGRHKHTTVICGSVVPILQKMINILDRYGPETQSILSIVRVETGSNDGLINNGIDECEVASGHEPIEFSSVMNDEPCVDDKVASESGDGVVLLGTIFGKNGSGDFLCKLTNGDTLALNKTMVSYARSCFHDQISKLVNHGMPQSEAHHLEEIINPGRSDRYGGAPIISGNDLDLDDPEKNYEVEFTGNMPSTIVGIEVPNKVASMTINGEVCVVSAVRKLLYGIGSRSMTSGVKTARELFSVSQLDYFPPKC